MKRLVICTAALALCACAQPGPGASSASGGSVNLVSITQGGELVEVERTPDYSVIEVRKAPAGSVPSSLFALRGACAVARARGQKYLASTPEPGKPATHRITFPQAPSESQLTGSTKSVFTLAECQLLQF